MTRTRIPRALALPALALVLVLAGCGSDGSGGGYGGSDRTGETAAEATASAAASAGASVSLASVPGVGSILVEADGFTLYDFHKDKGTESSCYGACAGVWPPLLTEGRPQPGNGVAAAKLGTTKRKDGTVQVTYAGHPLYTYASDKPGDAKGHDIDSFGAEWYALTASGAEAED